ncbi:MAG: diacylglycerol kinase [Thermodesulfobacteriota bacterium]|nr:diacylglycerol kinase [Thermodesulfobacteriota bacterium]
MNTRPAGKKGLIRIWHALLYSLNGLRLAITQETSFKQELAIYIVLLLVLLFLPLSLHFKCLLFFANTMVLIVEIINSAIESIVDMASPDYHDLAEKGKDLGSAAVFISMVLVIILWLCAIYVMLSGGGV